MSAVRTMIRPDRLLQATADGAWTRDSAAQVLAEAVRQRLRVVVEVDSDRVDEIESLVRVGFALRRTETRYRLPIASALHRLPASDPPGLAFVSAVDVDVARLHRLDETLRADIPGSEGWSATVDEFRRSDLDGADFDPRTYLVAVEGGADAGLIRVWVGDSEPRLGMVGVIGARRRRGIASALLARGLRATVDVTGARSVTLEIDDGNDASKTLFTRLGARPIGSCTEMWAGAPSVSGDPERA